MARRGKGWYNEPLRHSLARKGVKTGRKSYQKKIKISSVEKITTTKYVSPEGFEFTFEPIEDTLTVEETKKGYTAKYLSHDEIPESPDDWGDDNSFLVNYHRDFDVRRKKIITEDDVRNLYQGKKIPQEKKYWIFPVDSYIHGGTTLSLAGGFRGRLPSGHERFDVSSVGAVLVSKDEFKSKKQAENQAESLTKTWNQYLSGDTYCLVKEKYGKDKTQIDKDITCGYYGFEDAKKELKTFEW